MERQQFISYINEPGKLDKHSLDDIEDLTKKFPYCQSLQILHLLNLHTTNHVMYSEQLKSSAAHIADRKRLRELIRGMQEEGDGRQKSESRNQKSEIRSQKNGELVPSDVSTEEQAPKAEPIVPVIEQDEEARLLKLKQIVEDRLKEITAESEESPDSTKLTREEIIDRFMEEEPSISRPKTKFFDPVKVAKSSREEQPGLVTETLAHIHIQQGNIDKAIEIYRKLSLTFPEKSGYFAAQIKKLSKEN
ncbi:MAG: hypothetical protein KAJ50_09510 [Bacteroidales bacterium]|nr:hypothetical protein [Bacteroidales bacterium]